MDSPEWYHKGNAAQRRDAEENIKRFSTIIQWRHDGCDSLIDVGSGSGDVLMDFVYPLLPSNFQRLVCSDLNPKILNYAQRHYGHMAKTEFRQLDIETEKDIPQDLKEQFDHVLSFYTLMWVKNARQGLRNIYQLLRHNGGDCLLVILVSHSGFYAFKKISQMQRWSKYMTDVDTMFSSILHSQQPDKEYFNLMTEAGFTHLKVELQHKVFVYKNLQEYKENMRAINPWINRIPPSLHDDYLNDLVSLCAEHIGLNIENFQSHTEFPMPYKLVVIYGRKPNERLSLTK